MSDMGLDDLEIDLSGFDADGGRGAHDVTDLYSEQVLRKARGLLDEARDDPAVVQQDPHRPDTWYVEGNRHYVVRDTQVAGAEVPWLTCTCPNGDARGARPSCYHTAAVMARILGDDLAAYR